MENGNDRIEYLKYLNSISKADLVLLLMEMRRKFKIEGRTYEFKEK